jgi:hypothetical protein
MSRRRRPFDPADRKLESELPSCMKTLGVRIDLKPDLAG